jgi:hypothetical protein
LIKNAGENVEGTTLTDTYSKEVGNVVDKGDARDLTHTKGHKRRISDRENADTWTSKKSKVSFQMRMLASLTNYIFEKKMDFEFRIKLPVGKKRSTVKISVRKYKNEE